MGRAGSWQNGETPSNTKSFFFRCVRPPVASDWYH